jgi:transcriptional regulator with XRE-family HTH domain
MDNETDNSDITLTRLRDWREGKGLTLVEVSDLTGVSASLLSRAERGQHTFPPMTRVTIARALGARVSDLFEISA